MKVVCLALAAAQLSPCVQAPSWRPLATEADRERVRGWRSAWTQALDGAREAGTPAPADALFDPDRAMENPLPPSGNYRCRFVKLGAVAGLATREWGRCVVGDGTFAKTDGPQRPTGRLLPDDTTRGVFLGTLRLDDEARPIRYGRDRRRDMVGLVQRIGEARWRIAMPRPGFESTLDLLELTPA